MTEDARCLGWLEQQSFSAAGASMLANRLQAMRFIMSVGLMDATGDWADPI